MSPAPRVADRALRPILIRSAAFGALALMSLGLTACSETIGTPRTRVAEVVDTDPNAASANLASLSEVVKRNQTPEAFNTRGVAYARVARYQEAIADFTAAIKLDPGNAAAFTNRALAYRQIKREDAALADFDHAIQANPQHAPAYVGRGMVYRQRNEPVVVPVGLAAVAQAFHARGLIYQRQGDNARAITDFDNAIDRDPFAAAPYQARGQSLVATGKNDQAIEDFNAALNVDNKNADAWAGLGLAYERAGNRQKAAESYRRALVLAPGNRVAKEGVSRTGRAQFADYTRVVRRAVVSQNF